MKFLFLACVLTIHVPAARATYPVRPKLILAIVVDQLRADQLLRAQDLLLPAGTPSRPGGFRFLMKHGAYAPFAEHELMNCQTAPGHSTILSGAQPASHGIALNEWFDPAQNKAVKAVDDPNHFWVSDSGKSSQPSASPFRFIGSNFADELLNFGFQSQIVSIALKDRASVFMAGRRAKNVFWYQEEPHQWGTSTYYAETIPQWVRTYNTEWRERLKQLTIAPTKGMQPAGLLSQEGPEKLSDPIAAAVVGMRKNPSQPLPPKIESASRIGVLNTQDFAIRAIKELKLGRNPTGAPDLLTLGLSTHDIVGHSFGPTSEESVSILRAEDQALQRILEEVRKQVPGGLDNVWIALTADHGVLSNSEFLKADGLPAGRTPENQWKSELNQQIESSFGKLDTSDWVGAIRSNHLWFTARALSRIESFSASDRLKFESLVRKNLTTHAEVARVFSESDVAQRHLPGGLLEDQILNAYYPGRSGHWFWILRPFHTKLGNEVSDHTSGYSYDRSVPLILFGKPFRTGILSTAVHIRDLARTLSFTLGVLPPAGASGRVLSEALSPR